MDQGKPWNDGIEQEVKYIVADSVAKKPRSALHEHKSNSILSLIKAIEDMINS